MRKIYLLVLLILNLFTSYGQNHRFMFEVKDKEILNELSGIISIDKVINNKVWAYANEKEFDDFQKYNIDIKNLPLNDSKGKALTMAQSLLDIQTWDKYPTFELYQEMLYKYAEDFPNLCKIDTIGVSENSKNVLVMRITDNPTIDENEPEVFYTGQMHGDEIVSYVLFLRLIDYLLNNYGTDSEVTDLINNVDIWINPLSNPDGTYAGGNTTVIGATRYNFNGHDLNRNFPTPLLTNPSGLYESEVQMMINFVDKRNFVLSANSHSGIELVNYPWDSWKSSVKKHPDHSWFDQISYNYANTVHENASTNYFYGQGDGVTHGGDWYVVDGSRQDYMMYFKNCREVTLELSDDKMLDSENLPDYWEYNKKALLGYIKESLYGIRGIVTDVSGNPLNATITVNNHDADKSEVKTDPITGNYHRMIDDGIYDLTFSVSGYSDVVINDINISDNEVKIVDVVFGGTVSNTNISGNISDFESGDDLSNVNVSISNQKNSFNATTDFSGDYSFENIPEGTYKFLLKKEYYNNTVYYETVSRTLNTFEQKLFLKQYNINIVITNGIEFIQGAKVNLSGFQEQNTNEIGQVQFQNIKATSSTDLICTITVDGYDDYTSTLDIISDSTINIKMIKSETSEDDFYLTFDNPNDGTFEIKHNEVINKVELYNMSGMLVRSQNYSDNIAEVQNLNSGSYIVLIYTDNNVEKKVVIVSTKK
ncbi:MAG: T9SS type A sorting domain-containing protein [bacterium]|nr:T9SS type A sorting domain-containing protein [bacterium]